MLPRHIKDLAIQRLTTYMSKSQILKDFPGLDGKIMLLINELKKEDDPALFEVFKKRIKILDTHRGINIVDYIPDLAEVFNE